METLVLGAGIVGSAAVWDLVRRGHRVTIADADVEAARLVGASHGAHHMQLDAADSMALLSSLDRHDIVVSAIPYRFGMAAASAAATTRTHYLDFGGNPAVVAAQQHLEEEAIAAGIMIVPDCGLAPGLANVIGEDLIAEAEPGPIESLQMRVGALPQVPSGSLKYQLAFSPAGLINEYAEPCGIIEDSAYTTVDPLSRFERVEWGDWGPMEAFSTAGGTSTMATRHTGRVRSLEYKTLRFPGHGEVFRALLEMGMFDEAPKTIGTVPISPRDVLIDALGRTLPRGAPDIVFIRVWRVQNGQQTTVEVIDTETDGISALARTTAFPATALADLIGRGVIDKPGVATMNEAVSGDLLLPELADVGIEARRI